MDEPDIEISKALADLGREFRTNELAYLAATTKIEGPFRDRLAFRLHQLYGAENCIVAREWNRVDLAILSPEARPCCLIELKAMYSFDATKDVAYFTSATSADEIKAQRLAENKTAVYSLLLMTHMGSHIEGRYMKPVKYSGEVNKAILKHGSAAKVLSMARDAVDADLSTRSVTTYGEVAGGSAFGLSVSVFYWLVRNDRPIDTD